MLAIFEYLSEFNTASVVTRLVLSVIFAGVIGFERLRKRRAAGLRTYMLVSIGATLAMLTDQYISLKMGGTSPTRIAAQVVSGVGFLGAGTIMVTGRNQIRGLTTAAGLWACACMGLALGSGFYLGAVTGFVLIFIVIAVLDKLEGRGGKQMVDCTIFVSGSDVSMLSAVSKLTQDGYFEKIEHVGDRVEALLQIRLADEDALRAMLEKIAALPGVRAVEEII